MRSECFNPRPRVGGDAGAVDASELLHVSIHAPAWGATTTAASSAVLNWFQSTPPRGGRPPPCSRQALTPSFNPRPRVGGDLLHRRQSSRLAVSIHAPAWGATWSYPSCRPAPCVSIHAPAWGATRFSLPLASASAVSIHAPAWGATTEWLSVTGFAHCFNPRPRVGGDV